MVAPPFYPVVTTPEERDAICEVIPKKLYLTSWRGAEDKPKMRALGVTHVAAVGSEFVDDEEIFVYWKLDIGDDEQQQTKSSMAEAMIKGAGFCNQAIKKGGCVLVHCAAGMSRSVTVVLADSFESIACVYSNIRTIGEDNFRKFALDVCSQIS